MVPQAARPAQRRDIVVACPGRLLDHMQDGARRPAPVSRSWCSTKPTACSTWASCPTCGRSCGSCRRSARRCSSRRPCRTRSAAWPTRCCANPPRCRSTASAPPPPSSHALYPVDEHHKTHSLLDAAATDGRRLGAGLHPHQAPRQARGEPARSGRPLGRGAAGQPPRASASAAIDGFRDGSARHPGRDRHRGARHRRLTDLARDQLRHAGHRRRLHAPHRPHRPGRTHRRRLHLRDPRRRGDGEGHRARPRSAAGAQARRRLRLRRSAAGAASRPVPGKARPCAGGAAWRSATAAIRQSRERAARRGGATPGARRADAARSHAVACEAADGASRASR